MNYAEIITFVLSLSILLLTAIAFGRLAQCCKLPAVISIFGSVSPFVLGLLSIFFLPGVWNYAPETNKWLLPLFIRTTLSISALPVITRILLDLGLLKSKIGSVVLAAATLDDITGWIKRSTVTSCS